MLKKRPHKVLYVCICSLLHQAVKRKCRSHYIVSLTKVNGEEFFSTHHYMLFVCTPSYSPCGVVYALVTEVLTLSCSAVCVASTTMLYRVFVCSAEML